LKDFSASIEMFMGFVLPSINVLYYI
jgi:hypothetical protein